jgi:hypothetical protein
MHLSLFSLFLETKKYIFRKRKKKKLNQTNSQEHGDESRKKVRGHLTKKNANRFFFKHRDAI